MSDWMDRLWENPPTGRASVERTTDGNVVGWRELDKGMWEIAVRVTGPEGYQIEAIALEGMTGIVTTAIRDIGTRLDVFVDGWTADGPTLRVVLSAAPNQDPIEREVAG